MAIDKRRLNTFLEIAGVVGAMLVKFAPLLPNGVWKDIAALVLAFGGGIGVRSIGTEYQDIADAKAAAKASLVPPPTLASLTSLVADAIRRDSIPHATLPATPVSFVGTSDLPPALRRPPESGT